MQQAEGAGRAALQQWEKGKHMDPKMGATARRASLFVAAILCGIVPCKAQTMKVTNALVGRGIVVYESGTPEFAAALSRLFDPGDVELLRPLLPFCLFVKNNTGGYLAALTVVYEVPEIVMPTGKPYRHTVSMRSDLRERSRMGEPGKLSFITPVTSLQGTLRADGTRGLEPSLGTMATHLIQSFLDEYGRRQISVSVDSIIDEDGILDGPDEAGLLDRINAKLRAQWDILRGIAGLHGDELAAALAPTSPVGLARGRKDDQYARTRQEYLDSLSRYLARVGEEQFMAEVRGSMLFHEIKRRGPQ